MRICKILRNMWKEFSTEDYVLYEQLGEQSAGEEKETQDTTIESMAPSETFKLRRNKQQESESEKEEGTNDDSLDDDDDEEQTDNEEKDEDKESESSEPEVETESWESRLRNSKGRITKIDEIKNHEQQRNEQEQSGDDDEEEEEEEDEQRKRQRKVNSWRKYQRDEDGAAVFGGIHAASASSGDSNYILSGLMMQINRIVGGKEDQFAPREETVWDMVFDYVSNPFVSFWDSMSEEVP